MHHDLIWFRTESFAFTGEYENKKSEAKEEN